MKNLLFPKVQFHSSILERLNKKLMFVLGKMSINFIKQGIAVPNSTRNDQTRKNISSYKQLPKYCVMIIV